MSPNSKSDQEFLEKLTEITKANLADEHFGVSELADKMGMSRSNLHRKVHSLLKISISQYLRQKRLEKGLELLQQTPSTVSEVAYKVGFSSPPYFNKCFHDYYGVTPGDVVKGHKILNYKNINQKKWYFSKISVITFFFILLLITIVIFFVMKPYSFQGKKQEKSIVVLPFLHYGPDTTNNFITEGLREELINKLP